MKTTRMNTTPIKPTLQAMEVGQRIYFPRNRRKSVRTSASDLKTDEDKIFRTWIDGDNIYVERKE